LARRQERDAAVRSPIIQAVVTAVDYGAMTATAQLADGTTTEVYPSHGVLPQVDQTLTLVRNGADLIALGGSVLVDGTFQSPDYTVGGSEGWSVSADGTVYFRRGVISADLVAALFKTADDPAADGGVVIDSPSDHQRVQFWSGADGEIAPGSVEGFEDTGRGVLRLGSPEYEAGGAGKRAFVDVGIDQETGATFGECVGDDWRVNGVSISRWPLSYKRRKDPLTIASSATDFQNILFDTDVRTNWAGVIEYNASNGHWSLLRAGVYDLIGNFAWNDSTAHASGSREIQISDNGTVRGLDDRNAVTTSGRPTRCSIATPIYVDPDDLEDGFEVFLQARQSNSDGASLDLTGRAMLSLRSLI
jgi:hypothetical protein